MPMITGTVSGLYKAKWLIYCNRDVFDLIEANFVHKTCVETVTYEKSGRT